MAVASLPIIFTATSSGPGTIFTASVPVSVAVVPSELFTGAQSVCVGEGAAAIWRVVVTIGGADVSSQVVGDVMIDATEGAARIAELSLRPVAGTVVALATWTGKAVTIDVADMSTGTPRYAMRRFYRCDQYPSA